MNAFQIILEKGQLGALKYANEIDNINPKLASEIDIAVAELEETAIKVSNCFTFVKRAQSSELYQKHFSDLPQIPQITEYSSKPGNNNQSHSNTGQEDDQKKDKLDDDLNIPPYLFTAPARALEAWLTKRLVDDWRGAQQALREIKKMTDVNKISDFAEAIKKTKPRVYEKIKTRLPINLPPPKILPPANQATNVTKGILAKLAQQYPKFAKVFNGLVKIAGPIAIALEAAGLWKMYNEEGMTPRFICNVVRAIASVGLAFTGIGIGGAIAINIAASVLCGFMPGKDGAIGATQTAPQDKVNERAKTITYDQLSSKDQTLANKILNLPDAREIKSQIKQELSLQSFKNPVDTVAYIQQQYNRRRFNR